MSKNIKIKKNLKNITENKIAEQKLKKSEEKFSNISEDLNVLDEVNVKLYKNEMVRYKAPLDLKKYKILIIGILLGVLYWIIESIIHTFIFINTQSLIENILFPPAHEVWMRVIVAFLLIISSIYFQFLFNRKKKVKQALKESDHNLGERIKELTCLYGLSTLVENSDTSIEEILHGALNLIPPAWQFPEITCAKIKYNNKEFTTDNFKETDWNLSSKIMVNNRELIIDIFYLDNKPFLKEEEDLIDDIGRRLKNIIEQKEAGQKLRESEEKFRSISSSAKDAIIQIDNNGKIIYWNEASEKIFSYKYNEAIGKDFHGLLTPNKHQEAFKQGLLKFLKMGQGDVVGKPIEIEGLKKYSTKVPIELTISPVKVKDKWNAVAIIRDISERKKIELKLKESEEKYRLLVNNQGDLVCKLDSEGVILFASPSYCKTFGQTEEEILGKKFMPLVHKDDLELSLKEMEKLYSPPYSVSMEHRELTRDGWRWLSWVDTAVLDSNNNVKEIIGVGRDITERKKMEEAIRQVNEELENKVGERTVSLNKALEKITKSSQFKTEFLARMSHELRTPLNPIIGFADLLLKDENSSLSQNQKEYLKAIKFSAEEQLKMVKNILDISDMEKGEFELNFKESPLKSMIIQAVSIFKPQIDEKALEFEIKGLKTEKKIFADPIRFKEILLNLLSNAVKFTKKGKIILKVQETHSNWIFRINDTGIGIADEDHDIIFKEFGRVNSPDVNSVSGSGLGLYLTKRLVHLHKGKINFESKFGKGSIFQFTIPKSLQNQEPSDVKN